MRSLFASFYRVCDELRFVHPKLYLFTGDSLVKMCFFIILASNNRNLVCTVRINIAHVMCIFCIFLMHYIIVANESDY